MTKPGDAPLVEWRLAVAHRRYEIVKLVLLCVTTFIVISIGVYLVVLGNNIQSQSRNNYEALTILRCAVSPEVRLDKDGRRLNEVQARVALDKCIANKGPSPVTEGLLP